MIIRNRRICKAVELSKAVHILPYPFIVRVENMCAVHMNMDPLHLLRVNIPRDLRALVDHQTGLSRPLCLLRKHCAVKPGANHQIIVVLHCSLLYKHSQNLYTL